MNINIIKTELNNRELFVIDTNVNTENETELQQALKDAIFNIKDGLFMSNTIYPIKINNTVLSTWINSQNYIHFFMGKYHMCFNSKDKLIEKETLSKFEVRKLIDEILEDNNRLKDNKYFN